MGAKIVGISRLFDSVCTTKIQLKSRVCINSYMRIDKWGDTYWVDDYTSKQGELIQFYKGGYTLFCLGKNDFRYIN